MAGEQQNQGQSDSNLPKWRFAQPDLSYASRSLFARTDELIRRCVDAYESLDRAMAESEYTLEQYVELIAQLRSQEHKAPEMLKQLEWALRMREGLRHLAKKPSLSTQIRSTSLVRRL